MSRRVSSRLAAKSEQAERQREFDRRVWSEEEEGLVIIDAGEKGRGVAASRDFQVGEYVTQYRGELITHTVICDLVN